MKDRIKQIMSDVLEAPLEEINQDSSSENIVSWDSLKHMNLVIALEEEFDVSFDEDDIPDIQSFQEIVTVLEKLI